MSLPRQGSPLVKFETPHAPDCFAVKHVEEGSWDHPWWIAEDWLTFRDAVGTKRGRSVAFLRVRCNNNDCPGLALDHDADDLLRQVPVHG